MGYKFPIPLKIVIGFSTPIFLWALYTIVFDPDRLVAGQGLEGWVFIAIYGGLLLFLYANNSGYRIAWDDERVYMREWGFRNLLFQRKPFHAVAYDNIVSMEGRFGNNAAAKSRFMPYEYLEIESSELDSQTIWIYPLSLNARDLADFLGVLYDKRPDIFSDVVLGRMRHDGLIGPVAT